MQPTRPNLPLIDQQIAETSRNEIPDSEDENDDEMLLDIPVAKPARQETVRPAEDRKEVGKLGVIVVDNIAQVMNPLLKSNYAQGKHRCLCQKSKRTDSFQDKLSLRLSCAHSLISPKSVTLEPFSSTQLYRPDQATQYTQHPHPQVHGLMTQQLSHPPSSTSHLSSQAPQHAQRLGNRSLTVVTYIYYSICCRNQDQIRRLCMVVRVEKLSM